MDDIMQNIGYDCKINLLSHPNITAELDLKFRSMNALFPNTIWAQFIHT